MKLNGHKLGFRGQYSVTVLKADGTVKENLNEAGTLKSGQVIKNRLLDNFFTRLISVEVPISGATIRCGTGSVPVSDGQSSLANQITLNSGNWPSGSSTNPDSFLEDGKLKASSTFVFTFNLGQINGNIAELGVNFVGTASASNTLVHSRALVVDAQGNPTVISVSVEEQLIITYDLFMETSAEDVVTQGSYLLDGVPQNVEITQRWNRFTSLRNYLRSTFCSFSGNLTQRVRANGALNEIGVAPSGGSTVTASIPFQFNYNVEGGKESTLSAATTQLNVLGGFNVWDLNVVTHTVKFGFNPPIPKTADRTLSITVRQTFGRLPE